MSLDNALLSLEGLSVGDAFGELFFFLSPVVSALHELPAGPWRWTDDTHMALSIVEILREYGRIDQDALARSFTKRFTMEPYRGYGGGAKKLLGRIASGDDWRTASVQLFGGGSYGNGAAMRAAPIGGFFSGDPERAAAEARLSAMITHAHHEGQAGAMAVAAAAAIAGRPKKQTYRDFIRETLAFVPGSLTRERIESSLSIPGHNLLEAVRKLGTGNNVSAQDTVPFCLWSAAHHLDSFEEAMWWTVRGLGDRDTTCAIVGGIVALSSRSVPLEWVHRREPLPDEFSRSSGEK